MVRAFLERLAQTGGKYQIQISNIKATLATGELFAPILREAADELARMSGVQLDVVPIRNERLGETITVAGLLMGADVIAQLQARRLGEVAVLPRIMFDHPSGVALDDVSVSNIADALGRPVALASTMSEILAVLTDGAN
jgi:NifB/MoaA-like Fe-S oxidoreductase